VLARQANAEWIKLRSLRSTWLLVGLAVVGILVQAITALATPTASAHEKSLNVMSSNGLPVVFLTILGVIAMASEYSQRSIITTYTTVRGRWAALFAKAIVVLAVGLVVGAVSVPLSRLVAAIWFGLGSGSWDASLSEAVHYGVGTMIAYAGFAAVGVMFGALSRSVPIGVGVSFLLLFVLDAILGSISVYSEYSFTGILQSLTDPNQREGREPLFGSAIALLAFYVLVLAAVTQRIESRRDV
jgi:ABC-type transport system involved in multi-copper enzyme maturation permease subunit